jgi:hypothetical protein
LADAVQVTIGVSAVIASYVTKSDQLDTDIKALKADLVGLAVPFATGLGAAVRAANKIDNAVDAAKAADKVVDATRTGDKAGDAAKIVDKADSAADLGKVGRSGRQERLGELANDPKVSSADRGWIKNEKGHVETGNREAMRVPPGKELAHARGREAAKGYSHTQSPSTLQNTKNHRTQHKYDANGTKNKERPDVP